MIKMQVIGNLGKDAQISNVNGKTVINFNVASTEKWRDASGNENQRTTWCGMAYWTEKTSIAQYLKSGVQVYCEGTADTKIYTPNNGIPIAQLTMRVSQIQLLGSPQQRTNPTPNPQPQGTGGTDVAQDDPMFEPLPF